MADYYIKPTSGTPGTGSYRGEFTTATVFAVGDRVVPQRAYGVAAAKGYIYECTTSGTSAGTEPTWVFATPDTSTTTSGSAVFTCRDCTTWANATVFSDYIVSNKIEAGDTVYRLSGDTETYPTTLTLTFPNNLALPCRYIAVSDTAEPPTTVSTCTIASGISGTGTTTLNGTFYMEGVNFIVGSGGSVGTLSICGTNASQSQWYKSCSFKINTTNTAAVIQFTAGGIQSSLIYLDDCNIEFSQVAQKMVLNYASLVWKGGALTGTVAPTNLFDGGAINRQANVDISGVDLSLMTTGKSLFSLTTLPASRFKLSNIKVGTGFAATSGALVHRAASIELNNVSSVDTNYTFNYIKYEGTTREETTLVKTGGATNSTTAYSFKTVTTANAKPHNPLILPDLPARWNETVGSPVTITVDILHDSLTNLQNDDIWMVVEYLGTSGFPKSTFINSGVSTILSSPTDLSTSSATWTTTDLTDPNKQKMSVTFTPQEVGYIQVRVFVGVASYTVYIDPKIQVS